MQRRSLDPWLADFVCGELAAVIHWKRTSHGIKPDPDSRFGDDGSNFRCLTSAPPPDAQLRVQLVTVLSVHDPTLFIVSDGQTRLKARISRSAVATLEAALDEELGEDVKGDVFRVTSFTVLGTPFGPADGFVQLEIDEIEYEHHLRKIHGQPGPIEGNEQIGQVIAEIARLRCPQDILVQGETIDQDDPYDTDQLRDADRTTATISVPQSSMASAPADSQIIQTQMLASSRRPIAPDLSRDGYQVQTGLNLQRPLQAGDSSSTRTNNVAGPSSEKLLGLLGQRRSFQDPLPLPLHGRQSLEVVAETPAKPQEPVTLSDDEVNPSGSDSAASLQTGVHQLRSEAVLNAIPPSAQPPAKDISSSLLSSGLSGARYKQCEIPQDQRILLDKSESWLPSLPGKRFPAPNVPIELFIQWKERMSAIPSPPRLATEQSEFPTKPLPHAESLLPCSASDISDDISDDDSEQELASSPWLPTPPKRRPELPPDSSFDNVLRGSQQDDLEIRAPKTMPIRKSPARPERPGSRLSSPVPARRIPPHTSDVVNSAEPVLQQFSMSQPQPGTAGSRYTSSISRKAQSRNESYSPPPGSSAMSPPTGPADSNAHIQTADNGAWRRQSKRVKMWEANLQGLYRRRAKLTKTGVPESDPGFKQTEVDIEDLERIISSFEEKDASLKQAETDLRRLQRKATLLKETDTSLRQNELDITYLQRKVMTMKTTNATRKPLNRLNLDEAQHARQASKVIGDDSGRPLPMPADASSARSSQHTPLRSQILSSSPPMVPLSQNSQRSRHDTSLFRNPPMVGSRPSQSTPSHERHYDSYRPSYDAPRSATPRERYEHSENFQHKKAESASSPPATQIGSKRTYSQSQHHDTAVESRSEATPRRRPPSEQSRAERSSFQSSQSKHSSRSPSPPRSTKDPDEVHRLKRRKFMQDTRRRDWLIRSFVPRASGNLRFQDILSSYRQSHPADHSVTAKDFGSAVKLAFPDVGSHPLKMRFLDMHPSVETTERLPTPVQVDEASSETPLQKPLQSNGNNEEIGQLDITETATDDGAGELLKEFTRNWFAIAPGGYCAGPMPQQRSRRRVDVLQWQI